ncbi:hypothetical protein [Roseibium sp. Sym1]|uniref:hypothetical protein n=1 Tax=Roseibium sp. Sym1 TaxID=3016006 RepID=UPI0022B43A3D|nr:hypothetical protein [Roseibium sp. Sym1]
MFLLLLFVQSNTHAQDCAEPVRFEETKDYSQFEALEAESKSEDEVFEKFAEVSKLGEAILEYKDFVSKEEFELFNDIEKIRRKWREGEGFIAQHLLLSFVYTEAEYLQENDYIDFLEEFLNANEEFCWLETDNQYFDFLKYKLREAQTYPQGLELEELIAFFRNAIWRSGDENFLQDYFDLMRLGGLGLVKEELGIWSERNSSNDFCSGVAHCIERIRIEFEKTKAESRNNWQRKEKKFDCEGVYANSSGKFIKVDLC